MKWAEHEKRFLNFPYKVHGWTLSVKIRLTAIIIIVLAFFEHFLFVSNSAYNHYQTVKRCNWTIEAPLSYWLKSNYGFIFAQYDFSLSLGLFVEVMNVGFWCLQTFQCFSNERKKFFHRFLTPLVGTTWIFS